MDEDIDVLMQGGDQGFGVKRKRGKAGRNAILGSGKALVWRQSVLPREVEVTLA